ncbi:hypothetical protein B0T18DRAFT_385147 [Schizothecium vesticola]|uniref:Extracellular membrane protein CFEM domain-containing protein n=1 Tax=Schizothecium vesticola TaxID=314040 RepID=A0AA40F8G0_9PEZI|nr:hypothetical protein B0T18DRAFT_385147 [Schizothecium vesticola]
MHFNIPALLAAIAMAATGTFDVDAKDGCRGTSVPDMVEFCIDECNARMHYCYNGAGKRCMKVTDSDWQTCSDDFQWVSSAEWRKKPECQFDVSDLTLRASGSD